MEGGMAQRAPKGSMKQVSRPMISKQQPSTSPQKWSSFWGFASGYASGLCFGVCFGGMLCKSATFHQYISRTTGKLTHMYICICLHARTCTCAPGILRFLIAIPPQIPQPVKCKTRNFVSTTSIEIQHGAKELPLPTGTSSCQPSSSELSGAPRGLEVSLPRYSALRSHRWLSNLKFQW